MNSMTTERPKKDPPIRADGRCAVCSKPRNPERSRRYGGPAAETDPFCSTECARGYHGTPARPIGEP
jgi:hypothetical protein